MAWASKYGQRHRHAIHTGKRLQSIIACSNPVKRRKKRKHKVFGIAWTNREGRQPYWILRNVVFLVSNSFRKIRTWTYIFTLQKVSFVRSTWYMDFCHGRIRMVLLSLVATSLGFLVVTANHSETRQNCKELFCPARSCNSTHPKQCVKNGPNVTIWLEESDRGNRYLSPAMI